MPKTCAVPTQKWDDLTVEELEAALADAEQRQVALEAELQEAHTAIISGMMKPTSKIESAANSLASAFKRAFKK